jgi:hypothetical protein
VNASSITQPVMYMCPAGYPVVYGPYSRHSCSIVCLDRRCCRYDRQLPRHCCHFYWHVNLYQGAHHALLATDCLKHTKRSVQLLSGMHMYHTRWAHEKASDPIWQHLLTQRHCSLPAPPDAAAAGATHPHTPTITLLNLDPSPPPPPPLQPARWQTAQRQQSRISLQHLQHLHTTGQLP